LQHPNLPSIYDHFEENGRWYLVMSFIQGETLEDYLSHASGHKLPLEEVLHIDQELCNVLHYLHTHQPPIIFRDLKAGNVMRTTDGHLYLIDFGIARHFKPGQAKDTANYGSAGYAPPEQYGKAQTTERSDIYSLGVTLYEMLSGYDPSQSPFTLPPLQSLVPTLPDRLVKLITQMLEMDASKRPASVKAVQQELQQATLSARPATQQYGSVSSMPKVKRPASVPHMQKPSKKSPPIPLSSTPGGQIHLSSGAAKTPQVSGQPGMKKRTRPLVNPKAASVLWTFIGVLFVLNGITGPFRFDMETAGGIFGMVVISGFSTLLGLLTILLACTKEGPFPVTKARRAEYIVVWLIGGIALLFGAIIAIIGMVTATPTNSNSIGTYLGIWLIIQGGITV
jgi:serine/threonine protein kinase